MRPLPKKEPLLEGLKKPGSLGLPQALWDAIDREAAIEGAKNRSVFVADLLVWAIHSLRDERAKAAKK
ncbi:MAG: hypothetical protein Q8K32_09190 [Archangium sp.]|nr:hypothetical protein [Archangium sp.]